jgi:hypothetical protein
MTWFGYRCQPRKVTLRHNDHPSHTETRCSLFVPSVKHPCETVVILDIGIIAVTILIVAIPVGGMTFRRRKRRREHT